MGIHKSEPMPEKSPRAPLFSNSLLLSVSFEGMDITHPYSTCQWPKEQITVNPKSEQKSYLWPLCRIRFSDAHWEVRSAGATLTLKSGIWSGSLTSLRLGCESRDVTRWDVTGRPVPLYKICPFFLLCSVAGQHGSLSTKKGTSWSCCGPYWNQLCCICWWRLFLHFGEVTSYTTVVYV